MGFHPKDANFVLAMFASSLLSGENCNNLDIRVTTVRGYVQAAQDLMVMGGYAHPAGLPMDKEHSGDYKKFVARAKKLESMPQRREMISDEMLDIFLARKETAKTNSLDDCFFDWLCMGRYTGLSAVPNGHKPARPHLNESAETTTPPGP